MGDIIVLDGNTANKIAAGEVVERPASVVKELVENALDAGASRIFLQIENSGRQLIKITDNGLGMSPDDALLALERHSTSKIRAIEDLDSLKTLGFRGEALPSMASVSRMDIITKPAGRLTGTRIKVQGGELLGTQEWATPDGTTVEIRDLFFNTPARKKFLKSRGVEFSHIADIITRYAIAYPEIYFKLTHDGKDIITAPPSNDLRERILNIYGKDLAKGVVEIHHHTDEMEISGLAGPPGITRATRELQSVFVNNRFIKSPLIFRAIQQGYHTLLPRGRYALAVVFIKMDPMDLDVNVHPAKVEVKFKQEKKVFDAVSLAVQNGLTGKKEMEIEGVDRQEKRRFNQESITYGVHNTGQTRNGQKIRETSAAYDNKISGITETPPILKPEGHSWPDFSELKPLGQIKNSFIIAEGPEGVIIIDQHAAHERVLFEKFSEKLLMEEMKKQKLLSPSVLEFTPKEKSILSENVGFLGELGFQIEDFGGNSVIVKSLPVVLNNLQGKEQIAEIVREILDATRITNREKKREEIIFSIACHNAIKAGDFMMAGEMETLFHQLNGTKNPGTCPHGRPTFIRMDMGELRKRFLRS